MDSSYDGIILGAGHNGLILQAYAARAGLKTLCIERRTQWGGGLATCELPPASGFRHNVHSFFHRGLTGMPWYQELELEKWGARYIEPELNVALLTGDGRSLEWWTDFEKTAQSVAQFSARDAGVLRDWRRMFQPVLQKILIPESRSVPRPAEERRRYLQSTAEGRLLLDVCRLSPVEFVRREFEHPTVQAGLLFFNGLREVDLRARGFGHHIPALLAGDSLAQMCRGGSRQLAAALVARIEADGGRILCGAAPRRIIVEHNRAGAVELESGERLEARRFIASSLNPQQTFCELLDPQHLPPGWCELAQAYRYNLLAPLFGLYVNLREPPRYAASAQHPPLQQAFMVILGLERSDKFEQIVECHERGEIPPTVMWGACPTLFDPSQAPAGKHSAFMWEKLPFALRGDPQHWEQESAQHGQRMLEMWCRFAPNLAEAVIDWHIRTPLDTARRLINMRYGDLLVGALTEDQMGWNRPFAGAGQYRGGVPGLYLCGSSSHPAGNITGLPGWNAARVLLADL
jgi:phytoene dehydrogenase-like protein